MGKTPTAENTHTNRGYAAAVGSALFLSMTAIFIRHLTRDYAMPALVLSVLYVWIFSVPATYILSPIVG